MLEEAVHGSGAEESGPGADGAGPAIEVVDRLAVGQWTQGGAHGEALPEGLEVGRLEPVPEARLAGEEQGEGGAAIEVELAEQAEFFERGVGEAMRLIEDQELGLGRGGRLSIGAAPAPR